MIRSIPFFTIPLVLLLLPANTLLAQEDIIPSDEWGEEAPAVVGSIEDYVAGWTKIEGMFTYYKDEATRRVLVSVNPDQLDHTFFVSVTLSRGTGDWGFEAPMMWGELPFQFRRNGTMIEFVEPNYTITTVMGEPMARAVERGISDTILGSAPVEAEDEGDGRVVFDLATFLLTSSGIDLTSWSWGYSLAVDLTGAYVDQIRGFPLNDEIDTRLPVYSAGGPAGYTPLGSQILWIHFSLSQPPDSGFKPRPADDRVGHFLSMSMNYSVETDRTDTRFVRYVNHFRLEKADPEAEISEPVEPIVFWLENSIPYEYRDAVREGILLWNDAFERIGFHNAIEVRQMPDDADWDPADIRYNTVRWFVSLTDNYAIGPSRADLRTGEIYDADIGVSADMMRSVYWEYRLSVEPIRSVLESLFPPGRPSLNGRQVRWDQDTLDILSRQAERAMSPLDRDCYAAVHAFEGARAAAILRSRGMMEPGSPQEEQFYHDYLVSLICHEVGHVLGLRHNFAGSAGTPYWKLNRIFWTREHGLSSSVMDYTTANVSPEGELQGEYWQTSLGDYDYWAIEYAYKPIDAETPEEELDALGEIASRAPLYRYGTDEDMYGWTRNLDPDVYAWDLSDDPVRFYSDRLTASGQLLDGILEHWSEPGTRPADIRRAFYYAIWDHILASLAVPRLIGGVRTYREHVGDPDARPAMVPVSAEDQRRALQFLRDKLWSPGAFSFDPELVNMLGRETLPTFDWSLLFGGIRDFDIHDWVLSVQSEPFYWIYDPVLLERVLNNEIRMPEGAEAFTLVELFDSVRDAVWSEIATGASIDSYRRNLQRAHLEMIIGIVLDPAYGTPEDAVTLARRDLVLIKNRIGALLSGDAVSGLDPMTAAHLDECLSRINLALEAPMTRGGGDLGYMFLY